MRLSFTFLFLILFSISNAQISSNMTLLDQYDVDTLPNASGLTYNDVWGYADCDGSEYAILGSASRIHFINVTNPTNIAEVGSFPGGEITVWRDMKTYHDRAYAVSDNTNEGLLIFDLSDLPNTVTKSFHSNQYFGKAHDIFVDEPNGRLYVVGSDTQSQGVIVFDLTADPDNPTLLASVDYPGGGYVHDLFVVDNIAYCSHGFEGFYIWDMTNPASPVLIASQVTGGYNHSSWISDDGSFVVYAEEVPTGLPLGVLDISGMHNGLLEIVNTFKFPLLTNDNGNTPHNPYIRGNYVISSYYEDGVQVFDISDRMNPQPAGHYDTHPSNTTYTGYAGNWGVYPFLPSGNILASDIVNGLFVLSLDGISLKPIDGPATPDISQLFPSDLEFCTGTSTGLELPSGMELYEWYKDGVLLSETSNFLEISEHGSYTATIKNRQCESISNTVLVTENQLPDVSAFPTNNVQTCQGETHIIEVAAGNDSYVWYKDGNIIPGISTHSLEINEPGSYALITLKNNCTVNTPPVDVKFNALPNIEITPMGPTEFCMGNWINLEAISNAPNASFDWSINGVAVGNTNIIQADQNGIYEVEITDGFGCTSFANIDITVHSPVVPTVTVSGNSITASTANFYQWFGENGFLAGENNQTLTVTESGNYYVSTLDDNGCSANSMTVFVDYTTSIDELETVQNLSIFPNPTSDFLTVDLEILESDNFDFEVWSPDGKLLLQQSQYLNFFSQTKLVISSFAKGMYFLKIKNEKGEVVRKFVKI